MSRKWIAPATLPRQNRHDFRNLHSNTVTRVIVLLCDYVDNNTVTQRESNAIASRTFITSVSFEAQALMA